MPTTIHLLWGATTTGKTAVSVARAREMRAPVISLDRVQCHPEISTGSGRPTAVELHGTERIYLCTRKVSEGLVSADDACYLLTERLKHLAGYCQDIVLEGGSISLLNAIARSRQWTDQYDWAPEKIGLPPYATYIRSAEARVRGMLAAPNGGDGIIQELQKLWPDLSCRPVLEDIDGYRQIIRMARATAIPIDQLHTMEERQRDVLVQRIAHEYWEHALWQERDFPRVFPFIENTSICEC